MKSSLSDFLLLKIVFESYGPFALDNKRVLRKNARGVPPTPYPVRGISCPGKEVGWSGVPCSGPGLGGGRLGRAGQGVAFLVLGNNAKSWQHATSIDIQWFSTIECQFWQNSVRIWQKIKKYRKTRLYWVLFRINLPDSEGKFRKNSKRNFHESL